MPSIVQAALVASLLRFWGILARRWTGKQVAAFGPARKKLGFLM